MCELVNKLFPNWDTIEYEFKNEFIKPKKAGRPKK